MVPLQKREHEAEDANHESADARDDRQDDGTLGRTLALHNEHRKNDKSKTCHEPKAHDDTPNPCKSFAFVCALDR